VAGGLFLATCVPPDNPPFFLVFSTVLNCPPLDNFAPKRTSRPPLLNLWLSPAAPFIPMAGGFDDDVIFFPLGLCSRSTSFQLGTLLVFSKPFRCFFGHCPRPWNEIVRCSRNFSAPPFFSPSYFFSLPHVSSPSDFSSLHPFFRCHVLNFPFESMYWSSSPFPTYFLIFLSFHRRSSFHVCRRFWSSG